MIDLQTTDTLNDIDELLSLIIRHIDVQQCKHCEHLVKHVWGVDREPIDSTTYVKNERQIKLEFNKWRYRVYERDGYRCQKCGVNRDHSLLHAHHIKKRRMHPELQFDVNNGITLCVKCHAMVEKNGMGVVRGLLK